jgi:hypothetical protein
VRFGKVETSYASEIPSEAQPMPEESSHAMVPAESSRRPADFANASPFKKKNKKKDPIGMGVMGFAIFSILVFFAAVAKIMMLQSPQ